MPFLPRLRLGRAVLAPARWRIPASSLPGPQASHEVWTSALARLRDRLRLPAWVSAGSGDRQLRLSLDQPMDLAVLRAHLDSRGFGVQVPGGERVLTWGFIAPGLFLCVCFVPVTAPWLLARTDPAIRVLSETARPAPDPGACAATADRCVRPRPPVGAGNSVTYATWASSRIRPPSRSRRRTRMSAPGSGANGRPPGGFCFSARCGRWML
jgi:hypothetical protein